MPTPDGGTPTAAAEAAWVGGLVFRDLRGSERLRRTGRDRLRRELFRCTDTGGTPHAELLPRLPEWLASHVRAAEWGDRAGEPLWDSAAAERFQLLARNVALLCGPGGRLALTNGRAGSPAPVLAAASRLAGWPSAAPPRKLLLAAEGNGRARRGPAGGAPKARPGRRLVRKSEDLPAVQSDPARLACLRSDWSVQADALYLAHHCEKPLLELAACGTPLLRGVWDIDVAIDGDPLAWNGRWNCVCWYSDGDCDYVELQIAFAGGLRVERQALLSRTDRFAFLADCISGARGARIDYASRLPLAQDVRATSDAATRECTLTTRQSAARVFPLALPCERIMGTAGAFAPTVEAGLGAPPSPPPEGAPTGLELRQSALGGLYAPLLIDWHPARRGLPADWRTLTVTEDGRILKIEAAAGHRLRIGSRQWLIYRALKKSQTPRSVLGHHTLHETVVGCFEPAGDVTPVLLVE